MKRDMELVRQVLIALEEDAHVVPSIDGYTDTEVMYQIKILANGGFLEAEDATANSRDYYFVVESLTWEGHEFLEAIRSQTIWDRTKEMIKEKGGSLPVEIVKTLAIEAAKKYVGL